jgi:MFS family permease
VPARSFVADLREGWDVFRSMTWVWTFVACATVGNVLFATWHVLGPVVAQEELGGAAAWAVIVAGFGAGSLLGGVLALHVDPARPLLVATLSVIVFALPLAALALVAPVPVLSAVAFVAGAGLMVSNTVWETTLQRHVPPESLSRVSAYDWFGSMALQPVGLALWGPVAELVGTSTAIWTAFGLHVASILALLAVREIRELPRFPAWPSVTVDPKTPVTIGSDRGAS